MSFKESFYYGIIFYFFDDFEAWEFGPVVPNVFYKYCGFGAGDINLKYNVNLDKLSLEDRVLIDDMIESKREWCVGVCL